MIARIIRLCAAKPVMTILLVLVGAILTIFTMKRLPLDALPDLSDTQVIVFAEWPGRSPDLIEDQITYPLVTTILSSAKVKYVRGLSMLGATQVIVVFEDGTDLYWARSRIAEKLASVTKLPQGVVPTLGPEATGLGWVYQYALQDSTGKHDLAQLRSLQDWNLRLSLQSIPGVAEVASIGGFIKQYEVSLDPKRLQAFKLSPLNVSRAIRNGNQETGANVLEMGGTEFAIRGRGYVRGMEDIAAIPVTTVGRGRVVTVGDLGRVQMVPAPRAGVGELDGKGEAVGGIVVMRIGENALNVIDRVKNKLSELKKSLPEGIEIVPVYDRSDLVHRAISTLKKVLVEEILVVALIVSIFLWHARASWVAILPLPIAVLLSFLPMLFSGLTVNLMSLGGIALAIGAMVDAGIILVENAHKKLEGRNTADMSETERRHIITEAMVEMGRPLFFSLLVITVSFLPIFSLTGREGRLFIPLAFTKTVSMAWAAVLAITLTPALAILFLKGKFVHEDLHPISRFLQKVYGPVVDFVVQKKRLVITLALLIVLATIPVMFKIPSEFMPALNEGTILYMPTSVPGMSLDTAIQTLQKQNSIIKAQPEVSHVYGKAGRAASATDPAPTNMFETIITLKPEAEWRSGMSYEKIIAELNEKLTIPGMPNIWWMPIQTRIEMLSTGIRTPVGIKVLGNNLEDIEKSSVEIEDVLKKMPETKSAFAERIGSGSYVDINVKRKVAALYGLNISDIHSLIESAVGGVAVSTAIEGRERYAISVRYAQDFRSDIEALEQIVIPTPSGQEVRLGQIASITVTSGASMIQSENGKMLGFVFVDLDKSVGLTDFVEKAKATVEKNVKLPTGVSLEWSGQFEALQSAIERLKIVVPSVLLLVVLILFLNTGSAIEVSIILLAIPFSLVGAFWLLYALGYKMSIASGIGLLALAGLDAETGVVMLLYLTNAYNSRISEGIKPSKEMLNEAIHEGAVKRVRPKLMTVAAALIGLLPVMWSSGAGSEVMKRIAAPMVGGIVTSGLLELLIYPAIFATWKTWEMKKVAKI
ncbi:MAG: efflux RND transporter permease subunit [Chitinophagaceae bacterium]|nr:efflux RND transporter permease subunit [Oligoflexus sp.]